jgi:hypothetical protein
MKKSPYTKPDLRERLKDRLMSGAKGGKPGEWSARKAQLLASEYKKAGGGYTKAKTASQKSLKKWTNEEWMTKSQYVKGKPDSAIQEGYTKRYLPKNAWAKLDPEERESTDAKKRNASKKGYQFVPNTKKAKIVAKKVRNS